MRKHFNKIFTVILLALAMNALEMPAFASDIEPVVDTITLDHELIWDGAVPVDISWKTKQDKGQWIEELGIADEADSLILIINNLDKEDTEALPCHSQTIVTGTDLSAENNGEEVCPTREDEMVDGKSRLTYFVKNAEDEWREVFSVNCLISGGELLGNESLYGVYVPEKAFGNLENPGSLLPYNQLTGNEHWVLDPKDERYGEIYETEYLSEKIAGTIKMVSLKTFFDYGMLIKNVDEDAVYSALPIYCQISDSNNSRFGGIQMPDSNLRMLIQCVDENTRIVVAGSLEELECK